MIMKTKEEIKRAYLLDRVAEAFRAIGQPDTKDLIFICESEGDFGQFDRILGIPVYKVPFINIRGGLLLAGRDQGWTELNHKLLKFQQEME